MSLYTSMPTPSGLSAKEYISVEGLTLAAIATVFAVAGLFTGSAVVMLLAGVTTLLSVGFTLATSAMTLMAPTQQQAG